MKRSVRKRGGISWVFIGNAENTKPSGVDIIENKVFKCASVWDFPDARVTGGR